MSLGLNLGAATYLVEVGVSKEEINTKVIEQSTSKKEKKVIREKGTNLRFRQVSAAGRSSRK